MGEVLVKAAAFVFIIFLGYALKRIGFFTATDYRLISKIVLNITLPAAVITAFANFDMDASLLILAEMMCQEHPDALWGNKAIINKVYTLMGIIEAQEFASERFNLVRLNGCDTTEKVKKFWREIEEIGFDKFKQEVLP